MSESHETTPLRKAAFAIRKLQSKVRALEDARHAPIAVIGMGCRFPGRSDSPDAYWQLFAEGLHNFLVGQGVNVWLNERRDGGHRRYR